MNKTDCSLHFVILIEVDFSSNGLRNLLKEWEEEEEEKTFAFFIIFTNNAKVEMTWKTFAQ